MRTKDYRRAAAFALALTCADRPRRIRRDVQGQEETRRRRGRHGAYGPPIEGDAMLAGKPGIFNSLREKVKSHDPRRRGSRTKERPKARGGKAVLRPARVPRRQPSTDALGKALRAAKRNNRPGPAVRARRSSTARARGGELGAAGSLPDSGRPDRHHARRRTEPVRGGHGERPRVRHRGRPDEPNIVYSGGAQGGVWKTTNALAAEPNVDPDQRLRSVPGDRRHRRRPVNTASSTSAPARRPAPATRTTARASSALPTPEPHGPCSTAAGSSRTRRSLAS